LGAKKNFFRWIKVNISSLFKALRNKFYEN